MDAAPHPLSLSCHSPPSHSIGNALVVQTGAPGSRILGTHSTRHTVRGRRREVSGRRGQSELTGRVELGLDRSCYLCAAEGLWSRGEILSQKYLASSLLSLLSSYCFNYPAAGPGASRCLKRCDFFLPLTVSTLAFPVRHTASIPNTFFHSRTCVASLTLLPIIHLSPSPSILLPTCALEGAGSASCHSTPR